MDIASESSAGSKVFKKLFSGASMKQMAHFGQIVKSGEFKDFDYGSPCLNEAHYGRGITVPPTIDLRKIRIPIAMIVGGKDKLATLADAKWAS